MAKRPGALDLALPPRPADRPAVRWLYDALRTEILGGRLRPGARLPGTRDLARQYGLARGTIVGAFERLASEGYVEGTVGSGTHVARTLPDDLLAVPRRPAAPRPVDEAAPARVSDFGRRVAQFPCYEPRPLRAFRANLPALDLFPTGLWAQLAARRARRASVHDLLGCESLGDRPLREAVADHLSTARGVRCTADQVVIVSGVQDALESAARLLVNPGDRVGVEHPGYQAAGLVFEALGAQVVPLGVDDEGVVPPPLHLGGLRLVYTTPAHQYPLGITMSLRRRLAWLAWANETGSLIFEDDYDSEYRYAGHPVPALQGLDGGGRVLFAGSFNKVLFPALRLGYLVAPPELCERLSAAKSLGSRHPALFEQRVLVDFMAQGHFGRHLRRMREIYAERRGVLLESACEHLAGALELSGVEAGLQTAGRLAPGFDAVAVTRAAADRGVEVVPLSRFSREPLPFEGLQLGFAAVDGPEIRRGVLELAAVLDGSVRPNPPAGAPPAGGTGSRCPRRRNARAGG